MPSNAAATILRANGVDLDATAATLGPWVSLDAKQSRFVADFADAAKKRSPPACEPRC
jgi:hypothetical protein